MKNVKVFLSNATAVSDEKKKCTGIKRFLKLRLLYEKKFFFLKQFKVPRQKCLNQKGVEAIFDYCAFSSSVQILKKKQGLEQLIFYHPQRGVKIDAIFFGTLEHDLHNSGTLFYIRFYE